MGVHFILMSKRLLLCEGSLLMSLPIFVASLHWISLDKLFQQLIPPTEEKQTCFSV